MNGNSIMTEADYLDNSTSILSHHNFCTATGCVSVSVNVGEGKHFIVAYFLCCCWYSI